MKKEFLRELNRELRPLTKEERQKCLNNYEELMLDKMENGLTEEVVVSDLGNVKQIAKDILKTYVELDDAMVINKQKDFNKLYMIFDSVVLVVSYIVAYYLCFKSNLFDLGPGGLSISIYMTYSLVIIPLYLFLYYKFKLYTIKYIKERFRDAFNIFKANFIGVVLLNFILYLLNQMHFSRIMVVTFVCINIIVESLTCNFIYYRIGYFHKKA